MEKKEVGAEVRKVPEKTLDIPEAECMARVTRASKAEKLETERTERTQQAGSGARHPTRVGILERRPSRKRWTRK